MSNHGFRARNAVLSLRDPRIPRGLADVLDVRIYVWICFCECVHVYPSMCLRDARLKGFKGAPMALWHPVASLWPPMASLWPPMASCGLLWPPCGLLWPLVASCGRLWPPRGSESLRERGGLQGTSKASISKISKISEIFMFSFFNGN